MKRNMGTSKLRKVFRSILVFQGLTHTHKSKSVDTVVAVTDDQQLVGNERVQGKKLHGHQDDGFSDSKTSGHDT